MVTKKASPHPEWATKHRVPGTELKKIKGGYYLYGVKGAYNPVTKKSRKVSLGIIGRITETGGLVKSPKGILRDGIKAAPAAISKVLDKEYGFSLFLFQHIKTSILPALRTHFPDDWVLIVAMVYCRVLHQSPLKNCPFFWPVPPCPAFWESIARKRVR